MCEVIFNKLEWIKEELPHTKLPEVERDEHIDTIRYAQTILGMLDENKIRSVIK